MSDKNAKKDDGEKEARPKFVVRSATDVQRIKLEKLMSNPVCMGNARPVDVDVDSRMTLNSIIFLHFCPFNQTKEVNIPVPRVKKNSELDSAPTFVRNVMGSSAGAGSGEFHVYRHLRRKEYARQKQIQQLSKQV